MAIPEHVKRQAMDAVNHRETTAQIRAYGAASVSERELFTHARTLPPESRPIPDAVKRQAMDAVAHRETTAQIRLMRDTGRVAPPLTPPTRDTDQVAGKVARLHHEQDGREPTQKTLTQDGFGREYG